MKELFSPSGVALQVLCDNSEHLHAYKLFGCQLNGDSKAVNSLLFSCPQTFDCSRQEKHPNKHKHPGVESF